MNPKRDICKCGHYRKSHPRGKCLVTGCTCHKFQEQQLAAHHAKCLIRIGYGLCNCSAITDKHS